MKMLVQNGTWSTLESILFTENLSPVLYVAVFIWEYVAGTDDQWLLNDAAIKPEAAYSLF